jgi:two-component system phosphate regulon sensor histidine kinase PhoR
MMRLALEDIGRPDAPMISMHDTRNISWLTDQVLRMERLVKNLLDLSSLEMEQTLEVEKVDLSLVLGSLVNDYAIFADSWEISMEAGIEKGLIVCGEYEKLTRAFSNLLDNALKYTIHAPYIVVNTINKDNYILIRVKDNGVGISQANQKKIFEKLYRVPSGDVHDFKGFGLGLSYVKSIVELHKGSIFVDSELGKGSTFTIRLPLT